MSATLDELAKLCGATLQGEPDCEINAVNTLRLAKKGDISFLTNRHYAGLLPETKASAVILSERDAEQCPTNALLTDKPRLAYARIANHLFPEPLLKPSIDENVRIGTACTLDKQICISANVSLGDNVVIGANTYIGPGCVIQDNVTVGDHCKLIANVTLCHDVVLGNRVILHPGVVIGADGFGFASEGSGWLKIPQIGTVLIFDDVDIGANSTVDRGAIEDTIIHKGVKIDNQVQIGHNVIIGENTVIAGCTGVAGSARIGERCQIGGAVGINGHIEIADDVIINGMSGVTNSIKSAGTYSAALPIMDNKKWKKNIIRFRRLDELIKKIMAKLD